MIGLIKTKAHKDIGPMILFLPITFAAQIFKGSTKYVNTKIRGRNFVSCPRRQKPKLLITPPTCNKVAKTRCILYCKLKFLHHKNRFLTSQIVGDLSANTTCRRQLLGCCDHLPEGVSRCWSWLPFSEENPDPYGVQLQTLVPI